MAIEEVKVNQGIYKALSKLTGKDYYKTKTGVVIKTEKGKGKVTYNTQTGEITCDGLQNAIIEGTSKADKIKVENSKNVKVSGGASDDEFTIKYSDTVKIDGGKGNNDKVTTYNSSLSSMKNAKYKDKVTESGNTTYTEHYDSNGNKSGATQVIVDNEKTVVTELDKNNRMTKETITTNDGSKIVKTPGSNGTYHVQEYEKNGKKGKAYDVKYDSQNREIWRKESDGTEYSTSYTNDTKIVTKTTKDGIETTDYYTLNGEHIETRSKTPNGDDIIVKVDENGDHLTVTNKQDGTRTEERKHQDGSATVETYSKDNKLILKTETYANGLIKESVSYNYDSKGKLISSDIKKYGLDGQLTNWQIKEFMGEGGTFETDKLYVDGQISEITESEKDAWGNEISRNTHNFNNADNTITETKRTYDPESGTVGIWSTQYSFTQEKYQSTVDQAYNETHMTRDIQYDQLGNIKCITEVTYIYARENAQNNEDIFNVEPTFMSVKNYTKTVKIIDLDSEIDKTYKYTPEGKFIECEVIHTPFVPSNGQGSSGTSNGNNSQTTKIPDKIVSVEDVLGRVTKTEVYSVSPNGEETLKTVTTKEYYLSTDLPLSETTIDYQTRTERISQYEYEGELLKREVCRYKGAPESFVNEINYEYYGNGQLKSKTQSHMSETKKAQEDYVEYYRYIGDKQVVDKTISAVYNAKLTDGKVIKENNPLHVMQCSCSYDAQGNKSQEIVVIKDGLGDNARVIASNESNPLKFDKYGKKASGLDIDLTTRGANNGNPPCEIEHITMNEYNNGTLTKQTEQYYDKDLNKIFHLTGGWDNKARVMINSELYNSKTGELVFKHDRSIRVQVDKSGDERGYLSTYSYGFNQYDENGVYESHGIEKAYNGDTKEIIYRYPNGTKSGSGCETIIKQNGIITSYTIESRAYQNRQCLYEKYETWKFNPDDGSFLSHTYHEAEINEKGEPEQYLGTTTSFDEEGNIIDVVNETKTADKTFKIKTKYQYVNGVLKPVSVRSSRIGNATPVGQRIKTYLPNGEVIVSNMMYADGYGMQISSYSAGIYSYDNQGRLVEEIIHYDKNGNVIGADTIVDGTPPVKEDDLKIPVKFSEHDSAYKEQRIKTLNMLKELVSGMDTQASEQFAADGMLLQTFDLVKELTKLGVNSAEIKKGLDWQKAMVKDLQDIVDGKSDLDFDAVFHKYVGHEYNQAQIDKFITAQQNAQKAQIVTYAAANFAQNVKNAKTVSELYNVYKNFYGEEEAIKALNKEFNKGQYIVKTKDGKINYYDKNGKPLDINSSNPFKNKSSDKLVEKYTEQFEKAYNINVKKAEDDYASAYNSVFGKTFGLQGVINKYCKEQQGFTTALSTTLMVAGVACAVFSGGVSVVAASGTTLATVGTTVGSIGQALSLLGLFGDNVLDLIDASTSENGMSGEEKKELLKETFSELGTLALGAGINTVSEAVSKLAYLRTTSKGLALLAQAGTDTGLSILSSLVINGELDLTSEGLNTLLSILSGVNSVKLLRKGQFINDIKAELNGRKITVDEFETRLKNSGLDFSDAETRVLVSDFEQGKLIDMPDKPITPDNPKPDLPDKTTEELFNEKLDSLKNNMNYSDTDISNFRSIFYSDRFPNKEVMLECFNILVNNEVEANKINGILFHLNKDWDMSDLKRLNLWDTNDRIRSNILRNLYNVFSQHEYADLPKVVDFINKYGYDSINLTAGIKLNSISSVIAPDELPALYTDLNNAINGKQSAELSNIISNLNNDFRAYGTHFYVDNDVDISSIDFDAIKNQLINLAVINATLPKEIYITKYMGGYIDGEPAGLANSYGRILINVNSAENSHSAAYVTAHETWHTFTIPTAQKTQEIMNPILKENSEFITRYIRSYAATNAMEYVAEMGALFADGRIKFDSSTGEIAINSTYLNINRQQVDIDLTSFKKLISLYLDCNGPLIDTTSIATNGTYDIKFNVKDI